MDRSSNIEKWGRGWLIFLTNGVFVEGYISRDAKGPKRPQNERKNASRVDTRTPFVEVKMCFQIFSIGLQFWSMKARDL